MENPYRRALLLNDIGEPAELEYLIGEKLTDLLIDLSNGISQYIAGSNGAKNPKPPFKKSKKKKDNVHPVEVPDGQGGFKIVKVVN